MTGCTSKVQLICPDLPTPVRPTLPEITDSELAALSDETYSKLAKREQLRRGYVYELESLITFVQECNK